MIAKIIADERKQLIILFVYAFLLIFFCSMMSPLYPFNDWSDINLYFNLGKAMFNGKVLYTEVFDHKGPFIFILYGFGYLISNTTFTGVYIIEALCWAIMILTAYCTARLYWDKIYAFVAALIFPILVLSHTSEGGSAEEFITITMVVSLFLFVRYFKENETGTHRPADMLIHGIMCSITLFSKINLVVFWIFPLLAVFTIILMRKDYKNLLHNVIAFIAGILIIALPICIYLLANNALSAAWDTYINLNRSYARMGGLIETVEGLVVRFYLRLRFDTFDFLIILLGAFYFPIKYIGNKIGRISIMLSFIALYTAIFITPGYVYYYSIPYYIYALLGCIVLCKYLKLNTNKQTYIILIVLAMIWGIRQRNMFGYTIGELVHRTEKESVLTHFKSIISQEPNPTLINLGLDSNNAIFTQLGIVPSVKYFVTPNLSYAIYPEMRNEQTKYIEEKQVQFVILPQGALNYEYFTNLPALAENYICIDHYKDQNNKSFYLYKRKD